MARQINQVDIMDYEFSINIIDQPIAEFSMGHEAFGHWLSEELGNNTQKIADLLSSIEQLELRNITQKKYTGVDLQLVLDQDDAEISGLFDGMDDDIPEETNFSEDDTSAACGLLDLKHAVLSWQEFTLK